ncbi:MAG: ergothioneine biosynthesis protein EgtB, partial [Chitinophagaceae bacterium]
MTLQEKFNSVRQTSEDLCKPLIIEDYSIQPSEFASPPKWHLAHVTWFWEQFVLSQYLPGYKVFDDDFSFLFNSYYNNVGKRVLRPVRGLMTRPGVAEVYDYRAHVNKHMNTLFAMELSAELESIIEIGLNHEQQHQELFVYDIKYILGNQPTFPKYATDVFTFEALRNTREFHKVAAGVYEIGHNGQGFAFDNEFNRHKTYVQDFEIADQLVSNAEYMEFMN